MASNDAFITEIDSTVLSNKRSQKDLLDPVRKEYEKIKEHVEAFNVKVEVMIEKQRQDYLHAYEFHMNDVQRELFALRDKVAEIANDDTKNEKMNQLKKDQEHYKSETLTLESDIDELRQKMRIQVEKTYSVEKSRDWLLKKLKIAHKKFKALTSERNQVFQEIDSSHLMGGSIGTLMHPNSIFNTLRDVELTQYSINLEERSTKKSLLNSKGHEKEASSDKQAEWKSQLNAMYAVKRNMDSGTLLPPLLSEMKSNEFSKEQSLGKQHTTRLPPEVNILSDNPWQDQQVNQHLEGAGSSHSRVTRIATGRTGLHSGTLEMKGSPSSTAVGRERNGFDDFISNQMKEEERDSLAQLIGLRSRRREIQEFLIYCEQSCHKRPWSRVNKRPLPELLALCEIFLDQKRKDKPQDMDMQRLSNDQLQLACELAATPEVYNSIAEVLYTSNTAPGALLGDPVRPNDSSSRVFSLDGSAPSAPSPSRFSPLEQFQQRINEILSATPDLLTRPHPSKDSDLPELSPLPRLMSPPTNTIYSRPVSTSILKGVRGDGNGAKDTGVEVLDSVEAAELMGFLDKDLIHYLKDQKKEKKLRDIGFYQPDNFLQFNSKSKKLTNSF